MENVERLACARIESWVASPQERLPQPQKFSCKKCQRQINVRKRIFRKNHFYEQGRVCLKKNDANYIRHSNVGILFHEIFWAKKGMESDIWNIRFPIGKKRPPEPRVPNTFSGSETGNGSRWSQMKAKTGNTKEKAEEKNKPGRSLLRRGRTADMTISIQIKWGPYSPSSLSFPLPLKHFVESLFSLLKCLNWISRSHLR